MPDTQHRDRERSAAADHFLHLLWRRKATVVVAFLATMGAAAAATFSLPKVYSTEAFLLITPTEQAAGDFAAIELNQTLAKTYTELLQTPNVAEEVAAELPYALNREQVLGAVNIAPVPESRLIKIEADASSPQRAATLADTYADVFVASVDQLSLDASEEAQVSAAQSAPVPNAPSRPQPVLYLAIAAVIAAVLAAAMALLRDRLSQDLGVDATTTGLFGLPVMGRVPKMRRLEQSMRSSEAEDFHARGEPFRLLYTNISFMGGSDLRSIAVVSSEKGEGKSVCAANLARAAADLGVPTLLVDGDLRLGTLSLRAGLDGDDVRAGSLTLSDALFEDGRITDLAERATPVGTGDLLVLPAGGPPDNPGGLLSSGAFAKFERQAAKQFRLVVFDTPPVSIGADASLIASRVDATILVVDAEASNRRAVIRAIDQLQRADARPLGVVINRLGGTLDPYGYYQGEASRRARMPSQGQPPQPARPRAQHRR